MNLQPLFPDGYHRKFETENEHHAVLVPPIMNYFLSDLSTNGKINII